MCNIISVVDWIETELSYLNQTKNERSISLQMDLITEVFKEAKEIEKKLLEKAFIMSDSYFSFKQFYENEILHPK